MEESAIRELVARLCRPNRSGGAVIERAAILASGSDSAQIVDWITDHGGLAEGAAPARAGGLHGARLTDSARAGGAPVRYVMPAGVLD